MTGVQTCALTSWVIPSAALFYWNVKKSDCRRRARGPPRVAPGANREPSMAEYILRRLFATIPVLAVVAVVVFSILHLTPGDPAATIAGDQGTEEQIQQIRQKLGFDRPIYEQFYVWLADVAQGNLGVSIFSNKPVTELLMQRIEPTEIGRASCRESVCQSV